MTIDDLHRVQEIDYNLLCVVDEICKKNNIQYFLMFGALLGAIRHKAPIPWDDDIDIAMTRENYMRFLEIAPKQLDSSKYFLKLMGSGSAEYVSEIKVGDRRTLYCMPGCEDKETMNSVTLDVFCFDKAKIYSRRKFNFLRRIAGVLWLCKQNSGEKHLLKLCIDKGAKPLGWFYKCLLDILHCIRFVFGERFFEWCVYIMFVDKSSKSNMYWERTSPHYFKEEWLNKTIDMDFGPRCFPVPIGYDEVLRAHYGDYMKLPSGDKRLRKYFDIWVFKELNEKNER